MSGSHTVSDSCLALEVSPSDLRCKEFKQDANVTLNNRFNQLHTHFTICRLEMTNVLMCASIFNDDSMMIKQSMSNIRNGIKVSSQKSNKLWFESENVCIVA